MSKSARKTCKTSDSKCEKIIAYYRTRVKTCPDTLLYECKAITNLEKRIELAALSISNDGKKHPHQNRVNKNALEKFADLLITKKAKIEEAKSFDELFEIVEQQGNKIKGIGSLTVYDVALRLKFDSVLPGKIYLLRGSKEGAKNLLEDALGGRKCLEKDDLPNPFQELKCFEIEQLLCICKDMF